MAGRRRRAVDSFASFDDVQANFKDAPLRELLFRGKLMNSASNLRLTVLLQFGPFATYA